MNGHVFRSLVDSSFICAKLLLKKKKQLYSPICQKIRLRGKIQTSSLFLLYRPLNIVPKLSIPDLCV